jgi:hypothetical protein
MMNQRQQQQRRQYTEAAMARRYRAGDRIELGGVYFMTAEQASRLGLVEVDDRAAKTYRRLLSDPAAELARITEALEPSRPGEPHTGNRLR